MGLGVSAASESGGSQQQKNLGVSAAEKYGTGGLSSTRIWGSQQYQRGPSSIQGFEPCSLSQMSVNHGDNQICFCYRYPQLKSHEGRDPGARVKAACLESRRSRVQTPLWPSSFKRKKCFFPAHS